MSTFNLEWGASQQRPTLCKHLSVNFHHWHLRKRQQACFSPAGDLFVRREMPPITRARRTASPFTLLSRYVLDSGHRQWISGTGGATTQYDPTRRPGPGSGRDHVKHRNKLRCLTRSNRQNGGGQQCQSKTNTHKDGSGHPSAPRVAPLSHLLPVDSQQQHVPTC